MYECHHMILIAWLAIGSLCRCLALLAVDGIRILLIRSSSNIYPALIPLSSPLTTMSACPQQLVHCQLVHCQQQSSEQLQQHLTLRLLA